MRIFAATIRDNGFAGRAQKNDAFMKVEETMVPWYGGVVIRAVNDNTASRSRRSWNGAAHLREDVASMVHGHRFGMGYF